MATGTLQAKAMADGTLLEFNALVRAHQKQVFRILVSILGDASIAEELTQETFLKAFKAYGGFRGESSVSTWLISIGVNLARDYMRNRRQNFWRGLFRSTDQLDDVAEWVPDQAPRAERALIAQGEVERVMRSVRRLPPKQREVFVLRFLEELTNDEIAGALGLSVGTVKAHLSRAVATVRRAMQEQKQ